MSQSTLDANQVLKAVYNAASNSLNTTPGTPQSTATDVIISHLDDSIRIGDGTNLVDVTASKELKTSDATVASRLGTLIDSGAPIMQLNSLVPRAWDFIAYTATSTTDIYIYKSGGSAGTVVATITVTWTDATKTTLSTVART